ncbi:MAG: hypothetical protein ACI9P5_004891 [Saprospiraceae bacterium]|jgi:hypothetical protein
MLNAKFVLPLNTARLIAKPSKSITEEPRLNQNEENLNFYNYYSNKYDEFLSNTKEIRIRNDKREEYL